MNGLARRDGRHRFVVSKDPGPPVSLSPFFQAKDICKHGYHASHQHPGRRRGCCWRACPPGAPTACPVPKPGAPLRINKRLVALRRWALREAFKTAPPVSPEKIIEGVRRWRKERAR